MRSNVLAGPHLSTDRRTAQRSSLTRMFVILCLILLGAIASGSLATAQESSGGGHLDSHHLGTKSDSGAYLVPGLPVDGVLTIIIPPGTGALMRAGETGYVLPTVIQLQVGDKIVIENNDIYAHMMLFDFVNPGERVERVFNQVTTETYSAGCTVDPTPHGFTSLFVSE